MRICLQNDIRLLYLPPHTSHFFQPLDLSIFRAIKALYQKAIRKINAGNTNKVLRYQFIDVYMQIRPQAMSESNILSGWRKSGISPLDRAKPLSSHFVKNPVVRDRLNLIVSPLNLPIPPQNEAVMSERNARVRIRELEREVGAKDAEIARLKAELKITNEALALHTTTKKRKIVKPAVDSNEKLVSFEAVLNTQKAVDLEEEEEKKRAEQRAAKAKKAAKDAQAAVDHSH